MADEIERALIFPKIIKAHEKGGFKTHAREDNETETMYARV